MEDKINTGNRENMKPQKTTKQRKTGDIENKENEESTKKETKKEGKQKTEKALKCDTKRNTGNTVVPENRKLHEIHTIQNTNVIGCGSFPTIFFLLGCQLFWITCYVNMM